MTGRNDRGVNPGRGIAGIIAAAVLLTLGAQGAVGAPSDKKPRDSQKAAGAQAGAKKPAPAPTAQQAGTVTRSVGGVQVAIDPATGRVQQPTAEQAQQLAGALQHMLTRETEGLPVTQLPDGTFMVNLEDTFQEVAMATVDRKGRVKVHCVNDAAQAMAILNGTAPAAPDTAAYGSARAADKKAAVKAVRDAAEKE
jgi:cell division protein FtsN